MTSPSIIRLAAPAAALSMLGFLGMAVLAPPALAQSTGGQTCRSALGEDFTVGKGAAKSFCCLVLIEKPWYDAHGVVASRTYAPSSGPDLVRPKVCAVSEIVGKAIPSKPGDTPPPPDDGNPPTTPDLDSLGSGTDDPPQRIPN